MSRLEWSDALSLDLPPMDDTHREFVELLAVVDAAADDAVIPAWRTLIAHTQIHFDQEDRWMRETRFAASNCHTVQHKVVLDVMREGLRRAETGDIAVVRLMAGELALWFPQHAQSMDAGLALHMRRCGLDPLSGAVLNPGALPDGEISGCGSVACTPETSGAPAAG